MPVKTKPEVRIEPEGMILIEGGSFLMVSNQ